MSNILKDPKALKGVITLGPGETFASESALVLEIAAFAGRGPAIRLAARSEGDGGLLPPNWSRAGSPYIER